MNTPVGGVRRRPDEAGGVCFERLEARMLLSGNVTAVVNDGNLIITGDNQGNQILIDHVGVGLDEVRISGTGTTINGQVGPQTLGGVLGHVRVHMGRGDDTVHFHTVDLPGNLTVRDIQGDNELVLDMTTVAGKLHVLNKTGDQRVMLLNNSDISRDVIIRNGRGDHFTSVGISDVGGRFSVSGGQGVETVNHSFSKVGSHVRIRHPKGVTNVTMEASDIGGHLSVVTGKDQDTIQVLGTSVVNGNVGINIKDGGGTVRLIGTVRGNVNIRGGRGVDEIVLNGLTAQRSVNIHTCDGDDTVNIDDVTITGLLYIRTGKGDDDVNIETLGLPAGPRSTFNGPVHISTSAGNDTIVVGVAGEAGNSADFNGRVRIDGGSGDDSLDMLANGNTFDSDLDIKNVEIVA